MLGYYAIAALIAGQLLLGAGGLSFARTRVLQAMSPVEKLCVAALMGITLHAFSILLWLYVGASLSDTLLYVSLIVGAGFVGFLGRDKVFGKGQSGAWRIESRPLKLGLGTAALALFSWVVIAALFLPTTDYDGIAI